MFTNRALGCVLVLTVIASGAASAQTLDFSWAARTGVTYSDNVTRSAGSGVDSVAAVAGLQVDGLRQKGRLRFDVTGQLDYYHYLQNSIDGEVIGSARGMTSYDIIPERLDWALEGSFDQQRNNLLLPAAPGNREEVLVLSTGPTWRARFGDAFAAVIRARYSDASYSGQSLDNNTASVNVTLERQLSARSAIGLGGSYSDVSYDTNSPFAIAGTKRQEYFATGRLASARTDVNVELGYANLDSGFAKTSDPLLRARVTRRISPFLSARLEASQQYPTTENALNSLAPVGITGDRAALSSTPRKQQSGSLGLTYVRPRTTIDLAFVTNREETVFGTPGTRKTNGVRGSLSRSLTPRSRATVSAQYLRDDYPLAFADSKETILGAEYSLAFGAKLSVDGQVQVRNRRADLVAGSGDEFTAGIFLRYGRVNARSAVNLPGR